MKWKVPIALVLLSVVPMIGGLVRLTGLARHSSPPTADDVRFFAAPIVTLLHIVGATTFSLLGAFQFSAELRRRAPRWHRLAGRVAAAAGLIAGSTGVWMAIAWEIPNSMQGPIVLATRVIVGSVMVSAIVLSVRAILRRDVATHEAWMIRAYALGQGAGTQVFVLGLPAIFLGSEGFYGLTRDVLMTLAWVINVVLAELIIRRAAARSQPTTPVPALDVPAAQTARAP